PLAPFEAAPRIVVAPNGDVLAFGRALRTPVTSPAVYDLAVARFVGNQCGNHVVDTGEACDDGGANGTLASCCTEECEKQTPGTACTIGACNAAGVCATPPPPVCGNGAVEAGETCDDGNTQDGDCCSATCQTEGAGQVCRASSNACVESDH